MKPTPIARIFGEDGNVITEGIQQPIGHPHIPYREAQRIANYRQDRVLLEIGNHEPPESTNWIAESAEWIEPEEHDHE